MVLILLVIPSGIIGRTPQARSKISGDGGFDSDVNFDDAEAKGSVDHGLSCHYIWHHRSDPTGKIKIKGEIIIPQILENKGKGQNTQM